MTGAPAAEELVKERLFGRLPLSLPHFDVREWSVFPAIRFIQLVKDLRYD